MGAWGGIKGCPPMRGAQSCHFPNMVPSVVGRNARRLTKSVPATLGQLKADLSHVLFEQDDFANQVTTRPACSSHLNKNPSRAGSAPSERVWNGSTMRASPCAIASRRFLRNRSALCPPKFRGAGTFAPCMARSTILMAHGSAEMSPFSNCPRSLAATLSPSLLISSSPIRRCCSVQQRMDEKSAEGMGDVVLPRRRPLEHLT